MSETCIAIIPARGGSTRLKGKNIYPFFDEPMLAWVVKSIQQVESISDVYVSSDDEDILAVADGLGCHTLLRPADIAQDKVPKIVPVRHAAREIERQLGAMPDIIVVAQANSPELRASDIETGLARMEKHNLWEVISLDEELVGNAAFRLIKGHALFNDILSAHVGAVRTDYEDIHTLDDLQRTLDKYPSKEAFLAYKGL